MPAIQPDQYSDGTIHPGVPYAKWLEKNGRQNAKDVDSCSMAYEAMAPIWAKIDACLGGTAAMRVAGETYLPKHQYEAQDAYDERLGRAVFDNYLLQTLEILVSKAFKEPPHLNDDVPEDLAKFLDDADGEGNAWHVVGRNWFRSSVAKGFAHLWVDYTQLEPTPDGRARTLADDQKQQLRPFWRVIQPENVRFMMGHMERGRFVLDMVRMYEPTIEGDGGWGEVLVERIRVLEPGYWTLYRKVKAKNGKFVWRFEDGGDYGLPFIPFVTYHTGSKTGLAECRPALDDLADKNIEHWQSSADQRSILTVGRFPMLACAGAGTPDKPGDAVKVGPKQFLMTEDPKGKFYYVEPVGTAISAGKDDLARLEQRMATYGAEFLREQADRASASGRTMDSGESSSQLGMWCSDFQDVVNQALDYSAQWMDKGAGKGGTITFSLQADVDYADQYELATLTAARARGDMSREAFMEELKRRKLLPPTYNVMADVDKIQEETSTLGALGAFLPATDPSVMAPPAAPGTGPGSTGLPGTPSGKNRRGAGDKATKVGKDIVPNKKD